MDKDTVSILRELADINKDRFVDLPIEMVEIIEGKKIERSWQKVEISKVLNYLASMLEI